VERIFSGVFVWLSKGRKKKESASSCAKKLHIANLCVERGGEKRRAGTGFCSLLYLTHTMSTSGVSHPMATKAGLDRLANADWLTEHMRKECWGDATLCDISRRKKNRERKRKKLDNRIFLAFHKWMKM
jgi:hypothetical protein